MPLEDGGCVVWAGAVTGSGYGAIRDNGKVEYVHRVVARSQGWSIEGMTIDHLCHNRLCVNYRHLAVVPREENSWRATSKAWREYARYLVAQRNVEDAGMSA
ncbi:HNH endonuclease [Actinoplanes subglobosus]|uniref:HNH endonuclease n=1 Tax=Actinoplanes subglobosus TaxID=1547892 RepID=A0ABV8IYA4_9ACTN